VPQVHLGIAGPNAYYVMWMTGYNVVRLMHVTRGPACSHATGYRRSPAGSPCTHAPAAMRQCNVYGLKPCLPAGRQTSTGTPSVDFATNNPAKVKTQVCYGTSATTLTSFVAAETEVRYPERFMGSFLVN